MKCYAMIFMTVAVLAAGCGKKQAGGPPPGFAIQVRMESAVQQPIEEKISLVATLSANEVVEIRSEAEGRVARINFEEGQPVKEGQLLISLDEAKFQATVAEAEANFNMAEADMKRSESMLVNKTISQQEYDQAKANFEAARATLDLMKRDWKDSQIFAQFDGIMSARLVSPGQVINKNTHLSTLVDIDPVKVEFRVPERFLGQLKTGQSIQFRVAAYGDEVFRGEVYFIDPQVDLDSRTVLVKATAANADLRLRPGMFGNLDLILRVKETAVTVPESSVVFQADQTYVYRVKDDQSVERVDVVLGERLPGRAEVVNGIAQGDRVVTEGIQKVHPGVKVREAEAAPAGETP